MGIWDFYCKICGGPFYYPEEFDDDDDEENKNKIKYLSPKDDEFKKLFDWIKSNSVIYPDGRIIKVGPYITCEGAKTEQGYDIFPGTTDEDSEPECYWDGLAVHTKCLNLSQLSGINNYNKLYFDSTFDGRGECGKSVSKDINQLCEDTGQCFEWELFLKYSRKIHYLVKDPDINEQNKQRIIERGKYVQSLLINKEYYHIEGLIPITIQTPSGKILVNIQNKYTVETILGANEETILVFSKIFKVPSTKHNILRILKDNGLLVGPGQAFVDHQEFPKLAEMSIYELDQESIRRKTKFSLGDTMLLKYYAIGQILKIDT